MATTISRICVKNLPRYVGEDRLREFFSQKGEVTDAKIMRTRDGKSRQFGFVGFRTEHEASEALTFFNHSYLDTSRITCEVAHKVGDPNIPRPWSKHAVKKADLPNTKSGDKGKLKSGTSHSKTLTTANAVEPTSKANAKNDPQLQEFLAVMQSRSKSKIWANDIAGPSLVCPSECNGKGLSLLKDKKIGFENSSDTRKDESDFKHQIAESSDINGRCESPTTSSQGVIRSENTSDLDYFRSRVKKNWSDSESDGDDSGSDYQDVKEAVDADHVARMEHHGTHGGNQQNEHAIKSMQENSNEENVCNDTTPSTGNDESEQAVDTGRLFVRNLPYTANEHELRELFSKFGAIDDVHLVVDKDTKQSKGIGYVLYKLPESASRALEELDNSIFQGRLLHVIPAKPHNLSSSLNPASGQNIKNFKQKREEQKKASEVSGNTKSWNSLFMRQETVVENIARKYGINKGDLLDRDADDLAVRIALGETHVIAETKKALSDAGVNVVALEKYASKQMENSERSNEVILVKNLPFHSSEEDLATMFGKYGSLDKIIFPPTRALALVVFLEPAEARAAFKGLAYKRYKDAPLYLEWAPSDILSSRTSESVEPKAVAGDHEITRVLEETVDGVPDIDLDPDRTESRSLFVKNLNFKTSDEVLKKHFSDNIKKGQIRSAKIKKHVKNGKNVSMGYGFVELDSVETATDVCRNLQGTILDGHALSLQLCRARKDTISKKKVDKDKCSTKIIVRNVAFEATEKDLKQLFSPFGQVKSVRLPMKFGSHRGFAFVEYITKQEAQNALQALSSTHLYGRHLVLEPAKEGETLEELRARTASQFSDDGFRKLSKKRKLMAVADEAKHKFESIME